MYRVVTQYRDSGSARPVVERGPWHLSPETAEYWADQLRQRGYVVRVESQFVAPGADGGDHAALAEALASMA